MVDPRKLAANPEEMRRAIRLRKVDPAKADLDRWLELDARRKALQTRLDETNAERNALGRLGRENPELARTKGQELRQRSRVLDEELAAVTQEWQAILDWFPNWPHPAMPEARMSATTLRSAPGSPGAATWSVSS